MCLPFFILIRLDTKFCYQPEADIQLAAHIHGMFANERIRNTSSLNWSISFHHLKIWRLPTSICRFETHVYKYSHNAKFGSDSIMNPEEYIRKISEIGKKSAFHFLILIFLFCLTGCGTRNMGEARLLGGAMINHLSEKGICHTASECSRKFDWTGEHENGVHWNIYDASDRKAVATLINFVVEHGIEITGGVPISITVYPMLRKDIGIHFKNGGQIIIFKPKNIIKIEVTA